MTDYSRQESDLTELLGLVRRPVAVSFLDEPPASIERFEGVAPAGCSFWRLASDGRVFYTLPGDHYNCPIGAHYAQHFTSRKPSGGTDGDDRVNDGDRLLAQ
jgi:uncharacterized protein (DUF169 family)